MVEKGHLNKATEAMMHAAQEHALRVNSIKYHTDGPDVSPVYRLCGESSKWWYISVVVNLC